MLAALLLLGSSSGLAAAAAAAVEHFEFRRDIEPIFVKRCSQCHGPDQQKSGLRLDGPAEAFKGGKSGKPAIVPGKSAESEVIRRVTSTDPDEVMPSKGERLRADQIQALRAWIDQGAAWSAATHWAFVKPAPPALPAVKNHRWIKNDIDRFVLARLEQEGLSPAPEAGRATLLRRLSLDLTGLPPTPDELDAFLNDRRRDAYERTVERLLASPHYGEHIARWWLDLARYADSNGFQVDSMRSIWPYRDWVIAAFNQNMRFDQFTIEQLAGDLLPNATLEQKIATGFNRNSKTNDEGGGDDEEYRTKAVKDRVATTASTWLGLTLQCAECHSHKYDPISQEDYYRFYAFFNSTSDRGNSTEPSLNVPPPSMEHQVRYLRDQIARTRQQLAEAERALPLEQEAWERRAGNNTNVWQVLQLTKAASTGGATFTNLPDQSVLATDVNPIYDTYLLEAETSLETITAILLEVLPDPSLPHHGPGRWGQTGNFILDEMGVTATPTSGETLAATPLLFGRATSDWEQRYYLARHAVDRNSKTGWAIAPRFGQRHFLIAELKEPLTTKGGAKLAFRFDFYHGNSHTIGRLRLAVTGERDPEALWPMTPEVAEALNVPPAERTTTQRGQLAAHARSRSPRIRALEHELFVLNERETELAATRYTTLVLKELPEPRPTFIQVRGNFLEKGKEVTAGVPAVLPPLPPGAPANRLTLAQWLVRPDNPLTARVTVNRFWERCFGTGLVKTSEDFGRQGEAPSHRELLDWLALEFTRTGWDVKQMQRLIVLSAAYRQSAIADAAKLAKDPYNRLLARGPRFRLDAESIRDNALAVSGLLDPNVGGPSVFPVQVPNLWKELGFLRPEIGMDEWPTSTGPDLYRRALYTFWRRVCTYPTFATFDAPSRDVCISRRPRTNTPLQALAALNDPTFLEAARVFAQRIMRQGGSNPARQIEFAFRACLARPPTKAEAQRLLSYYQRQLESFARDPRGAEALITAAPGALANGLENRQLAAWIMVANVLLNLDETLTKG